MPRSRNRDLPVLTCDLCALTTKNHFIFKRHRQRCLREHSSSALGSTTHKPHARSSEGEGVNEGNLSVEDAVHEETDGCSGKSSGKASPKVSPLETMQTSATQTAGPSLEGGKTSRRSRSMSDLDAGCAELATKRGSALSSKPEISELESGDPEESMEVDEAEWASTSRSSGDLPPPNVSRNYSCSQCAYATTKSREFLCHKIDVHKARIHIFSCVVCEYCSQYKHKLARHMSHAHNLMLKNEEIVPEFNKPGGDGVTWPRLPLLSAPSQRLMQRKKVLSSKVGPRSGQSLDSLLVKLRTKAKVTDASLSSFFSSASGQSAGEGGSGEGDLYKCKLCLFTGKSKNKVIRHLQACHVNARLFRCNFCTYKTYSKIEFYTHKKKHTNKNTTMLKCTECSYATEFRPNFERHMLQHGCNKPNKCSLCSYATDHEGALKRHVTSHHPNTAENQSLIIAGDESLRTGPSGDDGNDHNVETEAEEGLESDGFRCPICSSQYRRCSDLNRHMKSKHNVSRKDFLEYNSGDNDEETIEMDDDEFDDEIAVEEVTESEESDESQPLSELRLKDKPLAKRINKKCSYCSYIAKWPSDLRRHLRVHSMVKRFKCSLCWKKYKYLGDLNVHMRRDHEVNPDQEQVPQKVSTMAIKKNSPRLFRCPACPFFTKVKVDMDRHSHEHTEDKTYSCKLCRYETYWRGDMGRHLYRKHPNEVSKDSDLKEFFVYRPERRAISKGGKGVTACDKTPESDEDMGEDEAVERPAGKVKVEEGNEDSISDTVSLSDSLSNCSEATMDKDGNRIYRCQLCPFSNVQAHKIKNHMETHLNLKQFKCPMCGQRGNWKYDIRKHMACKHPGSTQDVVTLSVEEARATIQEYLATRPNIKRDHHLNPEASITLSTKPITARATGALLLKSKLPQQQQQEPKRCYEYKCSHCLFRSRYRWSVSKHQRREHDGHPGVGIIAKPITISDEGEEEEEEEPVSPSQEEDVKDGTAEKMKVEEEEGQDGSSNMFRCAECGKQGVSKGSIKKHYNYIHPNSEVRIISVADGVEFNYYTGLPTNSAVPPSPPICDAKLSGGELGFFTSKHSDPKKHGYVKPFQCSVCGQRSNWKWDIKKHLRVKHPDHFGYVIVLQLDQARATYADYSRPSPLKESEHKTDAGWNSSAAAEKDSGSTSGENKSIFVQDMPYKSQEMLLGRFRRYKCSGCGYRSNWRTDICRHIERRHKDDAAEVIFMDVQEARQTFMDYHYNPPNINPHTPGVSLGGSPLKHSPGRSGLKFPSPSKSLSPSKSPKKQPPITGKVWHCPKCPFVSALKSHIVSHMQKHGMKPFHCSACGLTSRFRSPIYRHIRKQHNSTDYSSYAKIVIKFSKTGAQGASPGKGAGTAHYVDAYLCRRCTGNTMETSTEEEMMKHLLSEHGSTDSNQALKIKKKLGTDSKTESDATSANGAGDETSKGARTKRYYCTICPYRTDKRGMLTFHHAYHQPTGQNKFKCKFCPYYVCAPRLLHQHMKCHEEFVDDQATLEMVGWKAAVEKTPPSSPSKRGKVALEATPKRHNCEKCPYMTNSKNDFLYHKQFHRPKPAAEYKCEHCDYWVTHRRLLKQHVRLHGEDYREDSTTSSPTKSLASDASAVLDAVEIAAIKQKMIANKITASLSTSPAVSPMKIATQCSVGNRPGFVLRNGMYKKLIQCRKCPYTNIRSRNVRLHELMHGFRKSDHPLMKCPYCDYYVGAKGLLSHHMKVHLHRYQPDPSDTTTFDLERQEDAPGVSKISAEPDDENQGSVFASPDIPQKHKVDTLLEISRFKKYSCEKCPYASGKRSHFLRHMELHGSRQRHTCQYCDYSVPSITLLAQHQRIHLMPNQNLLATQSFSNLQHLKEVPADVALASALPPTDSSEPVTISVVHDHLELYENDDNNSFDAEPKKLYRCDRCPYANVRRDHLLTHLRFHLAKSSFHCPYCDYSAPKQQLLTQHIRVHFCPLPELSDWLIENGQSERAQEVNEIDLTQALEVAEKFQTASKQRLHRAQQAQKKWNHEGDKEEDSKNQTAKKLKTDVKDTVGREGVSNALTVAGKALATSEGAEGADSQPSTSAAADEAERTRDGNPADEAAPAEGNVYICQYCDREFPTSKLLIAHELQHLIGNHFEFTDESSNDQPTSTESAEKATKAEEDHQHVATTATTATTMAAAATVTAKKEGEEMETDE